MGAGGQREAAVLPLLGACMQPRAPAAAPPAAGPPKGGADAGAGERGGLPPLQPLRALLSVAFWWASGVFLSVTNKHLMLYHGFKFPIALTVRVEAPAAPASPAPVGSASPHRPPFATRTGLTAPAAATDSPLRGRNAQFLHMAAGGALANAAVLQCRLVEREGLRSREHFRRVCVLAAVFAGTVLAGNWSLKYVHVSFAMMVGATTPFFTAALAYLLQGRTQAPLVYAALVPVIAGSVLAAYGEVNFHLLGYLLALGATVARAFKSLLQGELLRSRADRLHSQNLLRFMCPLAAGLLLVPALAVEGRALLRWGRALGPGERGPALGLLGANVGGAYCVNLASFLVTRHLGPLTLQVLGNAKGAATTAAAVAFFGNAVSGQAWAGYAVTLAGVFLYSLAKHAGGAAGGAAGAGGHGGAALLKKGKALSPAAAFQERVNLLSQPAGR